MRVHYENRWLSAYAGISRIEYVEGYNSLLEDGNHFLMWDFDDMPYEEVKLALLEVQDFFDLPTIIILKSGAPNCWHGNCFKRVPWELAQKILASTHGIDKKYLSIAILREFCTLRYSDAGNRTIEAYEYLDSPVPPTCSVLDIVSFAHYPKRRR